MINLFVDYSFRTLAILSISFSCTFETILADWGPLLSETRGFSASEWQVRHDSRANDLPAHKDAVTSLQGTHCNQIISVTQSDAQLLPWAKGSAVLHGEQTHKSLQTRRGKVNGDGINLEQSIWTKLKIKALCCEGLTKLQRHVESRQNVTFW